jgi:hypothetical protein
MDLFVAGTGLEFEITGGGQLGQSTSYNFDSSWSDTAFHSNGNATFRGRFRDASGAPYTVPYGHYVMARVFYAGINNQSGLGMGLADSSDRPVAGWIHNNDIMELVHNTGTASAPVWDVLSSVALINPSGINPVDLRITIDPSGNHAAELYFQNALMLSGTFSDSQLTANGLASIQIGDSSYQLSDMSQCYVRMDGTSIGAHVKTCRATGAGTHSNWTGSYSDVNEAQLNDTTVNTSTTAGQVQSYPMSAITVPDGYSISSAWHSLRAKNNGNAPENIRSGMVIGGTDHVDATNMTGTMGLGFSAQLARYDTNPATGQPWIPADWATPPEAMFVSEA